jgi:hypothetical protein
VRLQPFLLELTEEAGLAGRRPGRVEGGAGGGPVVVNGGPLALWPFVVTVRGR